MNLKIYNEFRNVQELTKTVLLITCFKNACDCCFRYLVNTQNRPSTN